MNKRTLTHFRTLALYFVVLWSTTGFAATVIENDTGAPLSIADVRNSKGEVVAEVWITGEKATVDGNFNVLEGPGYMEAAPGKYVHIVLVYERSKHIPDALNFIQVKIGARRIAWDKTGMTTNVIGLKPYIESMFRKKYDITSPLKDPVVKNGAIHLTVEGGHELRFRPKYHYKGEITGDGEFLFPPIDKEGTHDNNGSTQTDDNATSSAPHRYHKVNANALQIELSTRLKSIRVDSDGNIADIEGKVDSFSIAGKPVALTQDEIVMRHGIALILTEGFGEIKITSDSLGRMSVWMTQNQQTKVKKLLEPEN